jgi:hypothetical protein
MLGMGCCVLGWLWRFGWVGFVKKRCPWAVWDVSKLLHNLFERRQGWRLLLALIFNAT